MKNLVKLSLVVLISLFIVSSSFAGENSEKKSKLSYDQIENNLLAGLKSGNHGLQISAAYFLGEMKSEKAVIPLLGMLHDGETDSKRLMAALSLYKINSELAIYAVKEAAKFDDSERVRRMCANFYNEHLVNQYGVPNSDGQFALVETEYSGYKLSDFNY